MVEGREEILTEGKADRPKDLTEESGRADTLGGSKSLRGDDSNNSGGASRDSKDASKATADEGRSART